MILDARRRAYFGKAHRHLRENVLMADTGGKVPMLEKELDPDLQRALHPGFRGVEVRLTIEKEGAGTQILLCALTRVATEGSQN